MLPAPRDPHSPEAVPPDPPPAPPPDPPPLAHQLTGLLRSAGAQAARAVDGGRGAVLAEVGLADGDDVPALVHLVRAAKALGRGRGEWLEDLVVTLGRTVHVLRECDGVVLHARLDPARGDIGAVRRGLASSGLVRAAEAAGRVAVAERAGDGAGDPGARLGRPEPVPGGTARPAEEPAEPRPAAAASSTGPRRTRPRPEAEAPWPYSLPAPPPAAAPSPSRRVAHPAGPPPAAPRPAPPRPAAPAGPAVAALPTDAMQRVAPPPRHAPPRPLASLPGPSRPQPPPQLPPQSTPTPTPRPTPRPSPLPSPLPRPERLQEPPPVPLPRPAGGSGPVGRDPALVTVDGGPQLAGSGALAVLALPPVAALPRRRRAAPAPPVRSPRGMVTPPVLRQPWASDVPTMRRLVAGLHRLN